MKRLIVSIFALVLLCAGMAQADTPSPAPASSDTQARLDALQKEVDALKAQIDALKGQGGGGVTPPLGQGQPGAGESQQGPARTGSAAPSKEPAALVLSPTGPGITFLTPGGTVQLYGNFDLSYDITTKGLAQHYYPYTNDTPLGNVGYLPQISTNLSYFGVRGQQSLGRNLAAVYQLETQLDISSTSGTVNTNNNGDTIVKGGLTSRNSYVGVSDPHLGALKIGKTDAPYKTSTARMNPFSGEIGDYSVIMGNTGGDNRVEFGTRLDHSLWYESPVFDGFTVNTLISPGQNRAYTNDNIAAGESSCTGGNSPGSGALPPYCNDGSFGTAYSSSLSYQRGKLYLTTAYELHEGVNRTSDLPVYDPSDIVDESATKGGFQYVFSPRTSISGIYEDMERYLPGNLQYQNERSRNGFWLTATQFLTNDDNINFGWARANPTPGDPGQHNTPVQAFPDNMANLYTFAFKHTINKYFSIYTDYALTLNHPDAHYDLGAGGRGITTDCHDASIEAAFDPTTGMITGNGPHCYAGGRLQGFSTGLDFKF
jgi:predicted porin